MTREQKLDALLRLIDVIGETVATAPGSRNTHWTFTRHWDPNAPLTLASIITTGHPGIKGFNDEDWIELP